MKDGRELPRGYIDGFIGSNVYGWCSCDDTARVALRISGRKIIHVKLNIPRPDVKISLDLDSDLVGFEVFIPSAFFNGERHIVEILVIHETGITVAGINELKFAAVDASSSLAVNSTLNESKLLRAAVVCWDLAHNPAGRAMVLYDLLKQEYDHVDLIGPIFERFGQSLWGPLVDLNMSVKSRIVSGYLDLLKFSDEVSVTKYDLVWLCKPRLPSLVIGLRIAEESQCRIVLDIDDYEMSFFKGKNDVKLHNNVVQALVEGALHPADFDATAFAHSFIENFALKTVSNISLKRSFGGEVIPHARLASDFDNRRFNKSVLKKKIGLMANDKVVAFVGTVRKHKGILEIAEAVGKLDSTDVKLLVAGTYDPPSVKEEISTLSRGRAVLLDSVPFKMLPEVLCAADIICLPQDMDSETSAYQLPAKLIDGLSLNLKVIVNDLPTYDELVNQPNLFIRKKDEPLNVALERVFGCLVDEETARKSFYEALSVESVSIKVMSYIRGTRVADTLIAADHVFERIFGRPMKQNAVQIKSVGNQKNSRDLVVLWKQVDSGLFGRRVDMIAKYLIEDSIYDRIFILDAPITSWDLERLESRAASPGLTNAQLIYDKTVQKFLEVDNHKGIFRKAFITSERNGLALGRKLPKREDLHIDIQAYLKKNNVADNVDLLVYPIANHLHDVLSSLRFRRIIVDLVDDEREFASSPSQREDRESYYLEVLCLANIVMTNNNDMVSRFSKISPNIIHMIPNGVERYMPGNELVLRDVDPSKKIIGYIGNLRDRVDGDLLLRIANEVPNSHVLLIGPTGGNKDIEGLRFHPNVSMMGAMGYDESRRLAASFDVGLIPHAVNSLTDSMNPLKLFLYRELNVPIVSTPVKNLGKASLRSSDIFVSDGTQDDFVEKVKIAASLRKKGSIGRFVKSREDLWSSRIKQLKSILSQHG